MNWCLSVIFLTSVSETFQLYSHFESPTSKLAFYCLIWTEYNCVAKRYFNAFTLERLYQTFQNILWYKYTYSWANVLNLVWLPWGLAKPGRAACFRYLFEPQMFVCLFVFPHKWKIRIFRFEDDLRNNFPHFLYPPLFLFTPTFFSTFWMKFFLLPPLFFQLLWRFFCTPTFFSTFSPPIVQFFWWIFFYPHFFFNFFVFFTLIFLFLHPLFFVDFENRFDKSTSSEDCWNPSGIIPRLDREAI